MSKTKIILASTLSVLAVASVTTAAVVVTQKRKKQSDTPRKGNEVVVASDSKFEYTLNTEQTKELTTKLLLVKGQDVTVTLTENNSSKTIKTKVKEDGTIDFSTLKDGKTYKVTKIVVKDGDKERDLISEVKSHNEDPGQGKGVDAGGSDAGKQDKPADQAGDGKQEKPADQAGDGKQEKTADQAGDGKQDKPADQAGDGKQDKPADQAGDGKQDKPADQAGDGKQEKVENWIIKDIEFIKQDGVLQFYFDTTNSNFEKIIKDKEFYFMMDSNKIQEDKYEFGNLTVQDKSVKIAGVGKTKTHTTFTMISKRHFVKNGGLPEGTYKLLGVYPKDNPEQNLLQDTTKTVVVKYE